MDVTWMEIPRQAPRGSNYGPTRGRASLHSSGPTIRRRSSVMQTLWQLQQLIRAGKTEYGKDPGAPYVNATMTNYLESFEQASRPSTKRDHEFNHCSSMQRYCHVQNRIPEAVDWALSAISVADTDSAYDLTSLYSLYWPQGEGLDKVELAQFQHAATKNLDRRLDRRLVGATMARCLSLPDLCNIQ